MEKTVRVLFSTLALIFLILFSIEVALEYRHFQMGYKTPIFGKKDVRKSAAPKNKSGPKDEVASPGLSDQHFLYSYNGSSGYPFDERPNRSHRDDLTIWIASASHARSGRLPPNKIFPARICEYVKTEHRCGVINGSYVGISVDKNNEMLNEFYSDFLPDIAVLYQMSMIISGQQKRLLSPNNSGPVENNAIVDFTPIIKFFQSTSLYGHLIDYIGGNIKLSGQLKSGLPADMEKDFIAQIKTFLSTCRKLNIAPVLTTFAASHDANNIDNMSMTQRTNFVKFSSYLSPNGWINVIDRYNELMRTIAKEENVPLIDINLALNGKSQKFVDFVHFNKEGHRIVAETIGNGLNTLGLNGELR